MLGDAEFAEISDRLVLEEPGEEDHDGDDSDMGTSRRMDLAAWQVGRAIQEGRPCFESLLHDHDLAVVAAAAELLMLWRETRGMGKRALISTIQQEPDPVEQARGILELGHYAGPEDFGKLREWVAPDRPAVVRAAAAIVWAWVVNPGPLPDPAAAALREISAPDSDGFVLLSWIGVYHRGPWILPTTAAPVILRLADSRNDELRWRAVQGLAMRWEQTSRHLSTEQVVPVLLKRISDRYPRVRQAAALALSERGDAASILGMNVVPALLAAVDDEDAVVCGHAARGLANMSDRLSPAERRTALEAVGRAARRFANETNKYVMIYSTGYAIQKVLVDAARGLENDTEPGVSDILSDYFLSGLGSDARHPPAQCDRWLADLYARSSGEAISAATAAVQNGANRHAAVGGALWLMSLGPAAAPALDAIDSMAGGQLDNYARGEARRAADFIRNSLTVTPESEALVTPESDQGWTKWVSEAVALLGHPDPHVRAGAAECLGELGEAVTREPGAVAVLEKLLDDDEFAEAGVLGEFECKARLFHWRKERRSPRAAAIRALFALGQIPPGSRMLTAMLTASKQAAAI
jgi:HEAT repeat protein